MRINHCTHYTVRNSCVCVQTVHTTAYCVFINLLYTFSVYKCSSRLHIGISVLCVQTVHLLKCTHAMFVYRSWKDWGSMVQIIKWSVRIKNFCCGKPFISQNTTVNHLSQSKIRSCVSLIKDQPYYRVFFVVNMSSQEASTSTNWLDC